MYPMHTAQWPGHEEHGLWISTIRKHYKEIIVLILKRTCWVYSQGKSHSRSEYRGDTEFR